MSLVPHRFLFRISYPCLYIKRIPREDEDRLLDLPEPARIETFVAMEERQDFADFRLAWNEAGLGFQAEIKGKDGLLQGDETRLRGSDGVTFWLDTRDARASHRASRYCHQFYALPTGGGPERDQPVFAQVNIHRALADAPLCQNGSVPFRSHRTRHGYIVEAFLPAAALTGFDPEQNPRLGFYYAVKDAEVGEQVLSVGAEFPYWEDPSLWATLVLTR
jgi:hypothetical protein